MFRFIKSCVPACFPLSHARLQHPRPSGLSCRFLAALMCCFLAVQCPLQCYAEEATPSPSSSGSSPSLLISSGWDPLDGLSDEELEAYYDSFYDYPATLLDWPDEVPRPRFATAAVGTAALYVLMLVLCAAGIYCTVETVKDFFPIFQQYEVFLRAKGKLSLLSTFQYVLTASFGKTISGMKELYLDFKAFLNSRLSGYGTDSQEYILSGPAIPFEAGTYEIEGVKKFRFSSVSSPLYGYTYSYFDSSQTKLYSGYCILSASSFSAATWKVSDAFPGSAPSGNNASSITSSDGTIYYRFRGHGNGLDGYQNCIASGYFTDLGHFDTVDDVFAYIQSSAFSLPDMEDSSEVGFVSIPVTKSWADLQKRTYTSVADQLVIPAEADTGSHFAALDEQLIASGIAEQVTAALVDSWSLGESYTVDDVTDPPAVDPPVDIPSDVPGLLEQLLSALEDIWDTVITIPEAIADIFEAVQAIPAQIADFFTVDMAAVDTAASAAQDAFSDRFGGLAQLADIFSRSYSFDMVVPVFTMAVPDPLKFAFPGQDEFVILDLRPYAQYFLWARGLLVAMFWVMFAKWLLDQFDVKLHVG